MADTKEKKQESAAAPDTTTSTAGADTLTKAKSVFSLKELPNWHPIAKSIAIKEAAAKGIVLHTKTYRGGCHCGAISYDVTLTPPLEGDGHGGEQHTVVNCSCSVCRRNGYLLVYPTRDRVVFRNRGGQSRCSTYQFNHKIQSHLFCKNCGSSVMIDFQNRFMPEFDGYGVNVRSLYGVDVDKLKLCKTDGENLVQPAGDMAGQWYVESDEEDGGQ